jgi:heme-degrading monooxygenase HmoA
VSALIDRCNAARVRALGSLTPSAVGVSLPARPPVRVTQGAIVDMSTTTTTVTLINAFEVPSQADEAFITGWERARDFLAGRDGFSRTALHRALRPDAPFRFVNVARVDSPEAWRRAIADPAFPGGRMPFTAHPGLYEVVREDGACDGADGVILINAFEVPVQEDERFMAGWDRARELLAGQPGYLGTRLHRSLGPADFRFVNLARWSSPSAFATAVDQPAFRQVAAAMPFASHPALYEVIRD